MNFDTHKKKGFFKNIKSLYRFQIIDTNTYDVKWVIELSKLNILTITSLISCILLIIAFLIFVFTPLKYMIPGFVGSNAKDKKEAILLKLKVEQLEQNLNEYTQYYSNLKSIIDDSINIHPDYLSKNDNNQADRVNTFPSANETEINFRKEFEHLIQNEQDDISVRRIYMLNKMSLPMDGTPIALKPNETSSKTLKIATEGEAGINAVLAGVVLSTNQKGNHIQIIVHHDLGIISSYQFEGKSEVTKGEKLVKGQLIGVMGEQNNKILSFDLWEENTPLAPGQYLKY